MLHWISEHKIWVIGGAVVLAILYFMTRGGSSGATTSTAVGSDVASATALQQAQLAASAQGQQVAAAQQVQTQNTAAQLELGKLQIAQSGAHDQLAAQVATSNINATQQLQSLLGQLSANVATTQSNNDVAKTALATDVQKTQIINTTAQQQILANSLMHAYDTSAQTAQAGYGAQVAISQSHDQHSGGLFGGGGFLGLGF